MRPRPEKPARPLPDEIILRLNVLRVTRDGAIHVHGVGTLGMSDEARGQLASILGMWIDASLPRAESTEHAQAVNETLARVPKDVRVRLVWRWLTATRTNSLTEPEGIVTGIEVVEAVQESTVGANARNSPTFLPGNRTSCTPGGCNRARRVRTVAPPLQRHRPWSARARVDRSGAGLDRRHVVRMRVDNEGANIRRDHHVASVNGDRRVVGRRDDITSARREEHERHV